ncbi:hydroxymethylpyrimidine/phosphomethylpyrimidine kinase [Bartonella sp. AR 15-3]|nr:hydroxymethylpyrimidine/phosphomethylpyrimidine kinase [Bartonella sp. AR 15-3]
MLEASRLSTTNNHGTGCTISAAIAAFLPTEPLFDAVKRAKDYLNSALSASNILDVEKRRSLLQRFCELWDHR